MKNKFLLLGATALLSTGALMANAYLPEDITGSTKMDVKAEIVNNLNLRQERPLDFGRIAWDNSGNYNIALNPNADGSSTINRRGVSFNDGAQSGEVCFADLVPSATLVSGLSITVGNIEDGGSAIYLYDENGDEIAGYPDVDFGDRNFVQAITPAKAGERCFYIGASLSWSDTAKAALPAGKVHGEATVTVIYAATE